ncbi:MAG TPA: sigma-70 family RNA polymerase sigma factor [Vicinamibacterales bacterium]
MGAARSELLHDLPDDDLVRRAQAGEREAFAEIYRRYHAVVYRFARMMSGSLAIGEDITQETFTVLLRDLHRYKPQRSSISTYLYGVARNLTRSRLRRDRRLVRLEITEDREPTVNDDPDRCRHQRPAQHLAPTMNRFGARLADLLPRCLALPCFSAAR